MNSKSSVKAQPRSSQRIHQLSPLAEACLNSLGIYTFLTVDLCKLTVSSISIARIRRELKALSNLGLVGVIPQQRLAGRKFIYFLTKAGARLLSDFHKKPLDRFRFKSARSVSFSTDYEHRVLTVRAHIALAKALEQNTIIIDGDNSRFLNLKIQTWHTYFHKQGANRNAKTSRQALRTESKIDLPNGNTLIPDVNFVLADIKNDQACFLAVLEITRGNDAGRIIRQIKNHIEALKYGSIADYYHLPRHYPVLFLCEQDSVIPSVQKRFQSLPEVEAFDSSFLFASFCEFLKHPLTCWARATRPDSRLNFMTGHPHGTEIQPKLPSLKGSF